MSLGGGWCGWCAGGSSCGPPGGVPLGLGPCGPPGGRKEPLPRAAARPAAWKCWAAAAASARGWWCPCTKCSGRWYNEDLENGGSAPGGSAEGLIIVGGPGDVLPGSNVGEVAGLRDGEGEDPWCGGECTVVLWCPSSLWIGDDTGLSDITDWLLFSPSLLGEAD